MQWEGTVLERLEIKYWKKLFRKMKFGLISESRTKDPSERVEFPL